MEQERGRRPKAMFAQALRLNTLGAELEGVRVGPRRTENVRKQLEIYDFLQTQFDVMDQEFSPYLKLGH